MAYLEQVLREDERTYTSPQLAEKLEQERHIHLSPDYLRQVLKQRSKDRQGHGVGIAAQGYDGIVH